MRFMRIGLGIALLVWISTGVFGAVTISQVLLVGNESIPSSDIYAVIQSQPNQALDLKTMRKDVSSIRELYQARGLSYSRIYDIQYPTTDTGPLTFYISEGRVDAIIITGNTRTKDYVILREMQLKPGMILTDQQLRTDLRRIYNLNLFSELNPDIQPAEQIGHYTVRLDIAESPPSSFNVGGGYSAQSGLFLFSDLKTENFMGNGQQLSMKGQFGNEIANYELRFREPWMWDPRRSFSYGIWHRTGRLDVFSTSTTRSFDNNQVSTGMDMGFGIPFNYETMLHHTIKYEVVQRNNNPDSDYIIQSYATQLSHDTRDVWFAPRSGHYASIRAEKAFETRVKTLNFEKYDLSLTQFFPTFAKQAFGIRFDLGYIEGKDQARSRSLFGYIVGSQSTVRGYQDYFSFGARRLLTSVEYRWMLNYFVQLSVFVDGGAADIVVDESGRILGTQSIYDISQWRYGKGFGINIRSPIGPLKFDFANNDQNIWIIQFNFGQSF